MPTAVKIQRRRRRRRKRRRRSSCSSSSISISTIIIISAHPWTLEPIYGPFTVLSNRRAFEGVSVLSCMQSPLNWDAHCINVCLSLAPPPRRLCGWSVSTKRSERILMMEMLVIGRGADSLPLTFDLPRTGSFEHKTIYCYVQLPIYVRNDRALSPF